MGDYSVHFSHHELYHSDDVPPVEAQAELRNLAKTVLDPLRQANRAPLVVTSGFRGKRHNAAVGGASKSEHVTGKAADVVDGAAAHSGLDLFRMAAKIGAVGGLGLYWPETEKGSFIHVDTRPRVAGAITTWYRNREGAYVDLPAHLKDWCKTNGVKIV